MPRSEPKYLSVQEALQKLMNYCVYQDRCHQEVEAKLDKLGMQEEAKAHIIHELIQHDFLNESRFVESFIRGKFNYKQWGKRKISYHLKQKNIPQQLIDQNMSFINESDYQDTIRELIRKKVGNKRKVSLKDKQKVIRSLQTKGYEFGNIMDVWSKFYD
jgi:regulatory protein